MHALTMTRTVLDNTRIVDSDTAWVIVMPTFATVLFTVTPFDKLTSVPRTCAIKCQLGIHFFIDLILPAALRSWGRLSLQQK